MIEKYIQFAIDNGYKFDGEEMTGDFLSEVIDNSLCYTFIITSKPFIEALARGIEKTITGDYVNVGKNTLYADDLPVEFHFKAIVNEITLQQAIAIKEEELDEFITNLI